MKCPDCGLTNPPDGLRCDCGYDFEKYGGIKTVYTREKGSSSTAIAVYVLIGVAIVISVIVISCLVSINKSIKGDNISVLVPTLLRGNEGGLDP